MRYRLELRDLMRYFRVKAVRVLVCLELGWVGAREER